MQAVALRIGQVAREAGVSPDTLRHYERAGLLRGVARTPAGYRIYSSATVLQVQFIRSALRFGFSLKQIATFLRARDSGRPPCREVRAAAQEILARADEQLAALRSARRVLQSTLNEWDRTLAKLPPGQPARLLDSLTRLTVNTDCLSPRLRGK
jgi:MerR family Zn(II)-responsive transcriptional regulator of zntA